MAKIVTVKQMAAIEKQADEAGLRYDQMMENAGKAVAEHVLSVWPEAARWRILILVGTGNNGGDGLVAGHYLAASGAEVSYYLVEARPDDDPNLQRVREKDAMVAVAGTDSGGRGLNKLVETCNLLIDAMLGTGFKLPLREEAQALLKRVGQRRALRERRLPVVAIDCPSGLECDSGEVAAECIAADITVALAAAKPGLLRRPGADFVGRIHIGDIGMTEKSTSLGEIDLEMMDAALARAWLPRRDRYAHKGTFGRTLIVAGSINYPGAAVLAGKGAY
ncbi:MAG: NAD(P)H-hydrate epimerase, partial [Anaerolineales bacterium]